MYVFFVSVWMPLKKMNNFPSSSKRAPPFSRGGRGQGMGESAGVEVLQSQIFPPRLPDRFSIQRRFQIIDQSIALYGTQQSFNAKRQIFLMRHQKNNRIIRSFFDGSRLP